MALDSLIALKYAVETVPIFDGTNIPVEYFIEGCEEAKLILPREAEQQFIKIIRTKLVGKARNDIRDQDFNSIQQLTKYLKEIYGLSKDLHQLQSELGYLCQGNKENVINYTNRVKILRKQLFEAYENSQSSLHTQSVKELEKNIIQYLIRGLKPQIERRISKNLNFQETIFEALEIERELCAMADLRQEKNHIIRENKPQSCQICFEENHLAINCKNANQNHNKFYSRSELICQICKRLGHSADKCQRHDSLFYQSINAQEESNICQLCKKFGHSSITCQLNDNRNFLINNRIICQWCDKPGHVANDCWKKQTKERSSELNQIICQICNTYGHIAKNCRVDEIQSRNSFLCRKRTDHLIIKDCQLRIANNDCRAVNNQSNETSRMHHSNFVPTTSNKSDIQTYKHESNLHLDKPNREHIKQRRIEKEKTVPATTMLNISEPKLIKENLASTDTSVKNSKIFSNLHDNKNSQNIDINENIERKIKTKKRTSQVKNKKKIKKSNFKTCEENDYQIPTKVINNPQEEEKYQITPKLMKISSEVLVKKPLSKNLNNSRIFNRSFQTSLKNPSILPGRVNYQTLSKIPGEGSIQTSLESFESDCEEGSNQTSLRNSTFLNKNVKGKGGSSLRKIKLSRFGTNIRRGNKERFIYVSDKDLQEKWQGNNSSFNKKTASSKNQKKLFSKTLKASRINSQAMIDKFMRKRKSKHKSNIIEESSKEPKKQLTLQTRDTDPIYLSPEKYNINSIMPSTDPVNSGEIKHKINDQINVCKSNISSLKDANSTYLLPESHGKKEIRNENLKSNLLNNKDNEKNISRYKCLNKKPLHSVSSTWKESYTPPTTLPHEESSRHEPTMFNQTQIANQGPKISQTRTQANFEETRDNARATKRRTDPPDKIYRKNLTHWTKIVKRPGRKKTNTSHSNFNISLFRRLNGHHLQHLI